MQVQKGKVRKKKKKGFSNVVLRTKAVHPEGPSANVNM